MSSKDKDMGWTCLRPRYEFLPHVSSFAAMCLCTVALHFFVSAAAARPLIAVAQPSFFLKRAMNEKGGGLGVYISNYMCSRYAHVPAIVSTCWHVLQQPSTVKLRLCCLQC